MRQKRLEAPHDMLVHTFVNVLAFPCPTILHIRGVYVFFSFYFRQALHMGF